MPQQLEFHGLDGKLGDQLEHAFDRAHGVEGLLVAMAVQQRLFRQRPERQFQAALLLLAGEEFLQQQRLRGERVGGLAFDQRRQLVAES